MAMLTCSCCGEERDEWSVRGLGCHDEIKVCRSCVGGLSYRLGVPDSTPIFPVRDLGEAIRFYESAGFDAHTYEGGDFAFVAYNDESVFDLDQREYVGDTHAGCFLRVPNVDTWHAELETKRLPVGPLEDMPWGMREFRLTDPSGNYVRIGRSLTL